MTHFNIYEYRDLFEENIIFLNYCAIPLFFPLK